MKKQLFSAFTLALLLGNGLASAQEISKRLEDKNGQPYFIQFSENSVDKRSVDDQKLLKDVLGLREGSEMKKIETGKLFSKFSDDKYQLYYQNIKVEFATYSLHYTDGKLTSMSGEMYNTEDLDTTTKISEATALNKAVKGLGVEKLMEGTDEVHGTSYSNPKGELVFLPVLMDDDSYRLVLAYKFDIYSELPLKRSHMYIDANTGQVLLNNPIMKHMGEIGKDENPILRAHGAVPNMEEQLVFPLLVTGNAATRYSGTQSIETTLSGGSYILRDTTRGGGVYTYNNKKSTSLKTNNFTDADNNWTAAEFDNSAYDNAALDAHWGIEKTYDYFKDNFSRNSYNGSGAALKSYVHYGSSYENAGWTGSEMIYGDGASTFRPLTAFDVTAHELGHGVCEYSADLVYSRESGAINEGLSDIWGAVVEHEYTPGKQAFLIGEDITKVSPYYLRSMSNPNSGYSAQPDTYGGTYWKTATSSCTPTSSNDYCGVHYNSGVLNYWFYLLVSGGSGTNDLGNSFSVSGIGFTDAAKIVYRLETSYLSSNSTYSNVLTYGIQSAKDLFGEGSAQHIATQNAFYAVGLGSAYSGGTSDTTAPSAPTNLAASGTTSSGTTLSWTASTDNVAVTGYYVYQGSTLLATVTSTSYSVTGLSASTTYTFSVKAKDAAGNVSSSSNTVSVTTSSAADTTAPTAPTGLTASGTTSSGTTLSWTASTDNVGVTGYDVYQGSSVLGSTSSTTYTVSGLSASTTYTFSVKAKDAAGNTSSSSSTVSVTTLAESGGGDSGSTPPTGYCTSQGSNANYEWISKVVFNTINNSSSTKTGYEDFTSISTNVSKGSSYSISITPGFSSTSYREGYAVYIDFNRDGDFSDSGEKVLSKSRSYTSPQTGTITIPTSASTGATRMRVIMKYNATPSNPCETFSYGQVEDYIVNIQSAGFNGLVAQDVQPTSIYPNPVKDVLNIKSTQEGEYTYQVFAANGQIALSGKSSGKAINVSALPSGVYLLILDNGSEKVTEKFIKK